MITFLDCNAQVDLLLNIKISFLGPNGYNELEFKISSDINYIITSVETNGNTSCLKTYDCKIIGFHVSDNEIPTSFVNVNNTETEVNGIKYKISYPKELNVDYIKIDYSEEGMSQTKYINITDIRDIKERNHYGDYNEIEIVDKIENF